MRKAICPLLSAFSVCLDFFSYRIRFVKSVVLTVVYENCHTYVAYRFKNKYTLKSYLYQRKYVHRLNTYFVHIIYVLDYICLSQAGIDTEMLTIALEPEAAALYVKHLPVQRRVDGKEGDVFQTFSPGSKYIVVDAGGSFQISLTQSYIIHSRLANNLGIMN